MPAATEDLVYARGKAAMDAAGLTLSPWLFGAPRGTRDLGHRSYAIRVSDTADRSAPRRQSRSATVESQVVIRVLSRIRADAADTDYTAALLLRQTVRAAVIDMATGSESSQGPQHWTWVSSVEATGPVADSTHLYTDHTFTVRHELAAF